MTFSVSSKITKTVDNSKILYEQEEFIAKEFINNYNYTRTPSISSVHTLSDSSRSSTSGSNSESNSESSNNSDSNESNSDSCSSESSSNNSNSSCKSTGNSHGSYTDFCDEYTSFRAFPLFHTYDELPSMYDKLSANENLTLKDLGEDLFKVNSNNNNMKSNRQRGRKPVRAQNVRKQENTRESFWLQQSCEFDQDDVFSCKKQRNPGVRKPVYKRVFTSTHEQIDFDDDIEGPTIAVSDGKRRTARIRKHVYKNSTTNSATNSIINSKIDYGTKTAESHEQENIHDSDDHHNDIEDTAAANKQPDVDDDRAQSFGSIGTDTKTLSPSANDDYNSIRMVVLKRHANTLTILRRVTKQDDAVSCDKNDTCKCGATSSSQPISRLAPNERQAVHLENDKLLSMTCGFSMEDWANIIRSVRGRDISNDLAFALFVRRSEFNRLNRTEKKRLLIRVHPDKNGDLPDLPVRRLFNKIHQWYIDQQQ